VILVGGVMGALVFGSGRGAGGFGVVFVALVGGAWWYLVGLFIRTGAMGARV
jgi:hypothetical protein